MRVSSSIRIPTLDGVRGIAILAVLFHHFVYYSGLQPQAWLDRVVYRVGLSSWLGVDLFLVLSGFLITGILFDAKGSPTYFRSFYGRRLLRIFPLYYGFLALVMFVLPLGSAAPDLERLQDQQLWYWTYLSNLQIATQGWPEPLHLAHFWSLAIEEQFYLIWPLVVLGLGRTGLIRVCGVCFVGAFLLRLSVPHGISPLGAYVLMPARMDALAAGALLALAVRGPGGVAGTVRGSRRTLAAGALVAAALFAWRGQLDSIDVWVRTVGLSALACGFAGFVGLALTASRDSRLGRLLTSAPLVALGRYSYALYVFHHPIALVLRDAGWTVERVPPLLGSQLPGVLVFATLAGALSLACALVSWYAWESPFLRLKRRLPYRPAA